MTGNATPVTTSSAVDAAMVHKLYVAYFNRVADPEGLQYWLNSGASLTEIANAFGNAKQPETMAAFDNITDANGVQIEGANLFRFPELIGRAELREAFITQIYQNLFNRAPEEAGLAFWSQYLLEAGTANVGKILIDMISGAKDDANGNDLTTINNKITVSEYFVDRANASKVSISQIQFADGSRVWGDNLAAVLANVTDSSVSVSLAKLAANSAVDTVNAMLTNGFNVDDALLNPKALNVIGTAGDDVFATAGVPVPKLVDAGAGNDTLVLNAASIGDTAAAQFSNFETLKLTTATTTVDTTKFTNSKIANVVVADAALGNSTVTASRSTSVTLLDTDATLTAATLTINGAKTTDKVFVVTTDLVDGKAGTPGASATITLDGANADTLVVQNKTAELQLTTAGVSKLVVQGDDAVTLVDAGAVITAIDASGLKGALTYTPTTAPTTLKLIASGAGDDVLKFGALAATTGAVVASGAGNDKITVDAVATQGTATAPILTIDAGDGNDLVTLTDVSAGNVVIALGAGDDTVVLGITGSANTLSVDLGVDGKDVVSLVSGVATSSAGFLGGLAADGTTVLNSVLNFTAGDKIVVGTDYLVAANKFTVQQVSVAQGAAVKFADLLALATATPANSATETINFFVFNGDSYVVHADATAGFGAGDGIVKIVGVELTLNDFAASASGGVNTTTVA